MENFTNGSSEQEAMKSGPELIPLVRLGAEMVGKYLAISQDRVRGINIGSFAGLFDAAHFRNDISANYVRLWYCLNYDDNRYPEFFLALETLHSLDPDLPEDVTNMANDLILPVVVPYLGENDQYDTVVEYLKGDLFSKYIDEKEGKIEQGLVLKFASNFRNQIRKHASNELNPKDPYAKFVVSIFATNYEFHEFMNQMPEKVAYLLGYSRDYEHYPNFLRPILAAVDRSGKIIPNTMSESGGESYSLLQKSTPPPPNS
ncbi:hypothetical protein [Mariniradius sediminis]|uniref:Uncharacterized protein n=1 Tax=Mariniradius sediminis TaxID=2909237 RepID=A0ABS9BWI4_9BACT|nr:hypothetical protein [Mariniradius sediminis]MCF1752092.1 hypothetical protein [Mariniradius sediminis]